MSVRIKLHKVRDRQLEEVREVDPDGKIIVHHRTVDALARMLRSGTIDRAMHDAGRAFERAFALAGLDPLRASSLDRLPGGRSDSCVTERTLGAHQRVHSAIQALGGHEAPGASCLWYVLGHGLSLRRWALRQRWGGRAVRPAQATGVLVAALAALAAHYGYRAGERCALRQSVGFSVSVSIGLV